ncbi:MAG TPA: hypothetical protein VFW68_11370 [Rhodocyclaceae bacterium]|nr:hypothetical protein [Rhodocyclaceae bacterium]
MNGSSETPFDRLRASGLGFASTSFPFTRAALAAVLIGAAPAMAAEPREQVACHYTYGGETRVLRADPVASPYGVGTTQVGSYFLFRVVFQTQPADQPSIKVYTYADGDDGPVPIHQATYAYPPASSGAHGFTGLQRVYEPLRDGELEYWCGLEGKDAS